MMIIRLTTFFIVVILSIEAIAISSVAWSFYESLSSSVSLLKYTSDNKARDILSTVARVAETKMNEDGQKEMNDFFGKLVKQSEKDLDKFIIKEIFLVSNDGTVLSHSNPDELKSADSEKYNKPYYMRALRMRKGQLPTPQVVGKEYEGDGTYLGDMILKMFPDIRYQTILLSSPIYHTEKLEAIGSIHLIYNRGNVQFLMSNQREIFSWMLSNYAIIGFLVSILIWALYALFSFSIYRQGTLIKTESSNSQTGKVSSFLERKENTLRRYITQNGPSLDPDISLNINEMSSVEPTVDDDEHTAIQLDNTVNGKIYNPEKVDKNNPKPANPTEAMDAIFLD